MTAALAPTLLVLAGTAGLIRRSTVSLPLLATFAAAAFLAFVALWDYPRRCEFGPGGLVRVCAIRRHRIPWDDILVIRRARGAVFSNLRSKDPGPRAFGGLTAKVGRRTYLLVDQAESAGEHDQLVRLMASWVPDLPVSAARPPERTPPSGLYRRSRR